MKELTIKVNDSTLRSINFLAEKRSKSVDQISAEMLERGVEDAIYRMNRNARQWQKQKATNERIAELEKMLLERNQ